MHLPAIFFGAIVGISLGLTGGGGGILAVPMLVYGVGTEPHQALLVSLMAVGATALYGAIERIRRNEVDIRIGVLFALAGVFGAPLGARVAHLIPDKLLLILFSCLMVYVAVRMWMKGSNRTANSAEPHTQTAHPNVIMMGVLGFATGVLSGLFGIGGGFVIVPALVLVSGMPIHRAVATSLLVIPLVSVSGIAMHWWKLGELAVAVTLLFVVGGVVGMWIGTSIGRRLSAAKLQKTFAVLIVAVAVFNVAMTMGRRTESMTNDQIPMTNK
jgi:hypothetical protein